MRSEGKWQPARVDAQLVGSISRNVQLTLSKRVTTGSCRVRQVYTVPETVEHYHTRHSHEFDVEKAEELLPTVLARPLYVFVGKKSKSVTFVGEFDDEHYLMIPIKVLTHEL